MLVSLPVPNLIQGVSQQPAQMRLPSQAADQVNAYSSPTDGLTKRPPTQFVGILENGPTAANSVYHFIDRDTNEKYVMSLSGSTLRVWTLAGAPVPVYGATWGSSMPSGWSTYTTGADLTNTRMMSIADTTFIVNRSVSVAASATASPSKPQEALLTVTQGSYKCTYSVTVSYNGGTEATYSVQTWSGSGTAPAGEIGTIKTEEIAENLRVLAWTGFTVTRFGSTLHITPQNSAHAFTIRCSDSGGDTLLSCAKGRVPRISDLPLQGPNGFKVAVNPDPSESAGDYWVEFVKDSAAANGYWRETNAPGVLTTLDAAKMPYIVRRKIDTTNGTFFAVEQGPWSIRAAGDLTTNPWPSFVGQQIQDVFFYKNRLCFLASDKLVMSEAGNYYNFFRASVAQILDSDPIDIGTLHTSVSTLRAAVPFNQSVVIFSDQAQFVLRTSNDEPLSAATATIMKATEYSSASAACRPVGTGRSILFMQADARYAGMREYQATSADTFDAVDLTSHVNAYVVGTPNNLAVSSYDNLAVVATSQTTDPSDGTPVLWNYKWLLNGSEKIQSAWSRWTFPGCSRIVGMEWLNKRLYIITVRNNAPHLEFMDFEIRVPDQEDFLPHLDCLLKATTATYDGVTTVITTSLPSGESVDFSSLVIEAVVGGKKVSVFSKTSSTVSVPGNAAGSSTYLGIPYEMSYTFSPVYLRNGNVPVLDGRLTLTYGSVSFSETGYFKVEINSKYRLPYSYEYFGGSFDQAYFTDSVNLSRGTFRYPIHAKNDDSTVTVKSSSHFPVRLNAANFEAQFVARSRV